MKTARLVLIATCISAGLSHPTFAQGVQAPAGPQPLFARNLGIYYLPIRYADGTLGLRLTAAIPGSPVSQLSIDAGDVIFALDGQRFVNPADVANHVDRTTVDFIDAATNTYRRGVINLPPAAGSTEPHVQGGPVGAMGGNQIGPMTTRNAMRPFGQAGDGLGDPQPLFARNLGIYYVPIRYADGTLGLRLTAAIPGSPASQLSLGAGDVIFALDGQRFANPNDVARHVDRTTVDFVDAATNTRRRGVINLPPAAGRSQTPSTPGAPARAMGGNQIDPGTNLNAGRLFGQAGADPAGPQPLFARNLGIYYRPIRYADGTMGLNLTADPIPGSPASGLPLDAGDVIFALDDQRLTNPNDVANHFDQTTVDYVDSGTNTRQRGTIILPSQNP
jgi:S1-C subfamily serine protease